MKLQRFAIATLAALALTSGARGAQDEYPSRPVRMIVPFAPGGASDFVGRIIQPALAQLLGQQIVVDNRAGAAGNIGVEVAARSQPDGYTFLLGNVGTMAINPNYYTKFPVKPLRDLDPVTQVVDVPGCVVTHPSIPAKNLKELVAYMKANPGKLNYGAPAPSSANRLEMEMFMMMTGTKAVLINYKGGAGPATIGLLTGEVQLMFVTFSSVVNFAKQGKLRMLGVEAPKRVAAMADVPTMREQGYDMTVGSWQGIYLPKNTPRAIAEKLFKVSREAMKNPEVVKRLDEGGVQVVVSSSPADFRKFWEAENARFAKVIKDAHIETE